MAQSERNSHSKNRGGNRSNKSKNLETNNKKVHIINTRLLYAPGKKYGLFCYHSVLHSKMKNLLILSH